jgi:hypothetical protein
MKKVISIFFAIIMLATSSIASATSYSFVDRIDNWSPFGISDVALIVEGIPFNYTHDIRDNVNFAAGDTITSAELQLDFTDDLTDSVSKLFGVITWDNREFSKVGFDGSNWVDLGEVDNGQCQMVLDIDWLNDNGMLDVTIKVNNPGWNLGTAYLDHSILTGTAETLPAPAPVPEPSTFILLGAGLAGLGFARRRSSKK